MKAWVFDSSIANPREPCQLESVSIDSLSKLGIERFRFDADDYDNDQGYVKFKTERGYNYQDIVTISRETLPDYDAKCASFLREHIHDDEETR